MVPAEPTPQLAFTGSEIDPVVRAAPEDVGLPELVNLPPEAGPGGVLGPGTVPPPPRVGGLVQTPAAWAATPAPGAVVASPVTFAPGALAKLPSTQEGHLKALAPSFRLDVEELLQALRRAGWQPLIVSSWRSLEVQRALYRAGQTRVLCGFHNIQVGGKPAALAVDIVDRRYGWTDKPQAIVFFKTLGAYAYARGLHWGGSTRSGFSRSNPIYARHGLSWDPVHVQALPNSALAKLCQGVR